MLILVGFVATLAAVALLLAWFVAREVHAIGRRRGWTPRQRVASSAGAFVACAVTVFYSVVGVLMAVLG